MTKIKKGAMIMLISHGKHPKEEYPRVGATGEVLDAMPDEFEKYKLLFPKEDKHKRWSVPRHCFIVLDDGNLDKITEEEDNPYLTERSEAGTSEAKNFMETPKQKENV